MSISTVQNVSIGTHEMLDIWSLNFKLKCCMQPRGSVRFASEMKIRSLQVIEKTAVNKREGRLLDAGTKRTSGCRQDGGLYYAGRREGDVKEEEGVCLDLTLQSGLHLIRFIEPVRIRLVGTILASVCSVELLAVLLLLPIALNGHLQNKLVAISS